MKKLFLVLAILINFATYAQDKIESERPSETISPQVLGRSAFQAEVGYTEHHIQTGDRVWEQPNALLRYGLLDKLELRLNLVSEKQSLHSEGIFRKGLRPVELGAKASIFETKDKKFCSSVKAQVGIPFLASSYHETDKAYHRVRLLIENQISDKFRISYNAGSDWDSQQQEQNWVYTFSPELELTDKIESFIEVYGHAREHSSPEHILDAGIGYYSSPAAKLDLSAGVGLTPNSPDYFLSFGISIQLKSGR
jgi:hypothetical protein